MQSSTTRVFFQLVDDLQAVIAHSLVNKKLFTPLLLLSPSFQPRLHHTLQIFS